MADAKAKENLLPILTCAALTNTSDHICEEPVVLSCLHHICKKCLRSNVDYKSIKCKLCSQQNEKDLSVTQEPITFNFIFNDYFNKLCYMLLEDFKTNFVKFKEVFIDQNESIDMHVEFVREQIDIRIESLKAQLDDLRVSLYKQLEESKQDVKSKLCVSDNGKLFDEQSLKNDLDKWESCMANKIRLTNDEFYDFQRKLESIKKTIENNTLNLYFQESEFQLDQRHIGGIKCFVSKTDCNNNKMIFERVKDGNFKRFKTIDPFDMCVIPNGNLIVAHRGVSMYDIDMNLLKRFRSLHGLSNIQLVDASEQDELYFCNYDEHCIIKTDLEFNKLAQIKRESNDDYDSHISGMCNYNKFLYTCISYEDCIEIYDSNLVYQSTVKLNFSPQRIEAIKNIACIAVYEGTIFYNLDTLTEIIRYNDQEGSIGVVGNTFFQYCISDRKLSCYNANGELLNEIITKDYRFKMTDSIDGSICFFNSNLLISSVESPFILSI